MLKRILILLLTVVTLLTGLYLARIPLLKTAFNLAFEESSLRLLQVDGLLLNRRGVSVEKLVLALGRAAQTLDDVQLGFGAAGLYPQQLSISRATLTLPATDHSGPDPALKFSELINRLLGVPLQSVVVSSLEIQGISHPLVGQALELEANWRSRGVFVFVQDENTRIELDMQAINDRRFHAALSLASSDQPLLDITTRAIFGDDQLDLQGDGQLEPGALSRFLAPVTNLPGSLGIGGQQLDFEFSSRLEDDLSRFGLQPWSMALAPQSSLELSFKREEQPALDATATVDFPAGVQIRFEAGAENHHIALLSGDKVTFRVDEQAVGAEFHGSASALHCSYSQTLDCELALSAELVAREIIVEGEHTTTARNLAMQWNSNIGYHNRRAEITWSPGKLLQIDNLQRGDILVNQLAVIADQPGRLAYNSANGTLHLATDGLQLLLPRVRTPQLKLATRLTLSRLTFSHDADSRVSGAVHLAAASINLQRPGGWLPALGLQADIALEKKDLDVVAQLYSDQQKPLVAVSLQHDLGADRGGGQIAAEKLAFGTGSARLSRHFSHWPYTWDVLDGELSLDIGMEWHSGDAAADFSAKIAPQWQGLSGFYKDIGFVNFSGNVVADYTSPDQLITHRNGVFSLEQIDVGVPVTAINGSFRANTGQRQLLFPTVEARLFGGRIWTTDAIYRADGSRNRIDVGVDGIQLDQLLDLAGYDAVEGTGTISGLLPLDVSTTGLTMTRGMLAARAPGGTFRYSSEVTAGTNPAMLQVLEALRNYQYSIFQTEADYLDNGDLQLTMQLRGKNPDVQGGRPIHLNLNVTDNIPMLLRSLQAGRKVADMISKQIGNAPRSGK